MEEEKISIELFDDMLIEEEVKDDLLVTGKWAKAVGIFTISLGVLSLINFVSKIIKYSKLVGIGYMFDSLFGFINLATFIVFLVIYFFIGLYTIRFSNKMASGLQHTSQEDCDDAWHHLRLAYRIMGIVIIVLLSFILLVILAAAMF
ncbi:MAG: hypothetical protein QM687_14805 [Ferruginibacter sp.]